MFYRKTIMALFAVASVLGALLYQIRTADAAIRSIMVNVDGEGRIVREQYERMMSFLRRNGPLNPTTDIPITTTTVRDILEIRFQSPGYFPDDDVYVYFNPVNLYVIGFSNLRNPNGVFYFNDIGNSSLLTNQTRPDGTSLRAARPLGSSSYTTLDRYMLTRQGFNFGMNSVREWLRTLAFAFNRPLGNYTNHLLFLSQWVSEAARFIPIERTMTTAMMSDQDVSQLAPDLIAVESGAAWADITTRVRNANATTGNLPSPYQLGDISLYTVAGVRQYGLGVLLGSQYLPQ